MLFPKGFEIERDSVGGNISRWTASVSEVWGPWLPRELHTCRWEISVHLMWPLLEEIKDFILIFPNSSASQSWSYAATFKDNPLKENNADTRAEASKLVQWQSSLPKWTFIIVVEQAHSRPLLEGVKGGTIRSLILLTDEVQWQFAYGILCVFDTLALGFTLHWQSRVLS